MKIKELQLLLLPEVGLIDIEPCSELTLRFRDDNAVSLLSIIWRDAVVMYYKRNVTYINI